MSRRSIDTHFWNDSYIGELDPDLKMLFLYLISSPLSNMLGVYEIQLRRIAFDTGLSFERVKEGLERLAEDKKAGYVDGYIVLANFVKNQSYNINMLKSAINEIEEIPDSVVLSPFFRMVTEGLLRVSEGFDKGSVTLPNRVIREIESEVEVEEEIESEGESLGAHPHEENSEPPKILSKRNESKPTKEELPPEADIPEKEKWDQYLLGDLRYSKEFVEHLWDHLMVKGWAIGDPPKPIKDWRAYARKQNQWAYEYDQKQKKLEQESKNENNGSNNQRRTKGDKHVDFLTS